MPEGINYFMNVIWRVHMSFSTELMIVEMLFVIGQPKRSHPLLRLIFGLFFYALLCWTLPFFSNGWFILFRVIFQFGVSVLFLYFVLDTSPKCGLFIALVSYAIQHFAYNVGYLAVSIIGLDQENDLIAYMLVGFAVFVLVYTVSYFLIIRRFNKNNEIYINNSTSLLLAIITFFVTCSRSLLRSLGILTDYELLLIFSTLCITLVLLIQFSLLRQSRTYNEKRTIEQLLAAEENRHNIRQDTIDIINMKFHDLRYHLDEYRKTSTADNAEFFKEIANSIDLYDNTPDTGNSALNGLLSEKLIYCNANEIIVSCIIDPSVIKDMNPSDISSLFGNALDNAIQSVEHEEKDKRIISVSVRSHGQMGQILITNYCAEKPAMKDGLPLSSKDKNVHGFGMRSIRYIVEKYNGNLIIDYKDHMFTLSILLPMAVE
ncbi:MAG: sensor histidine kinase [Clostridia bacterium]|nr:sensor histidine kinase [Clostridia bacterium]